MTLTRRVIIPILLALASVAEASLPHCQSEFPTVSCRAEACIVPGLGSWHKTHILSFPFPESEVAISAIELVGKKNSEEIAGFFQGGVRPEGSLFCFSVDYSQETGMMSVYLAEEDNCDEWPDWLCDGYEFERSIDEFSGCVWPQCPWDEWFYPGYIPDERKVNFLSWIAVRLEN